jgi:hypothetical protein
MIPGSAEVCLSALFVDFDNVYLSLRRQSEEAAGRFARNPAEWMSRIATGGLVRFKSPQDYVRRRFAVARCYGNPGRKLVSRGGPHDPHSFAAVRPNFMMAGLEVVDCQPLSSQFKNGTDIKIACDIRDFLEHPTRFGEFIILSGDADFTPVLHHLRSHDRRTVVYANESTAEIYKAFSDGWIEEREMLSFLLDETGPSLLPQGSRVQHRGDLKAADAPPSHHQALPTASVARAEYAGYQRPYHQPEPQPVRRAMLPAASPAVQSLMDDFQSIGSEILNLVLDVVRASDKPVPIAYLADRAQKVLGHAKTLGTNWAGSGGFLNFLTNTLPDDIRLSDKPPHFVYDPRRHVLEERSELAPASATRTAAGQRQPERAPADPEAEKFDELQQSITRIYRACKAPPLPPSEYQVLFSMIAAEVLERGFAPVKTVQAVVDRAASVGFRFNPADVTFVLEAIDEMDPWLENSRSPATVARAYRDFVLARCRSSGVGLSDEEMQLVQVWFGASQWGAVGPAGNTQAAQHDTKRQSQRGHGVLPSPQTRRDVPLPPDFAFDRPLETQGAGTQPNPRFAFLKH